MVAFLARQVIGRGRSRVAGEATRSALDAARHHEVKTQPAKFCDRKLPARIHDRGFAFRAGRANTQGAPEAGTAPTRGRRTGRSGAAGAEQFHREAEGRRSVAQETERRGATAPPVAAEQAAQGYRAAHFRGGYLSSYL